ncbi:hypothetical protein BC937DRAFT_95000 [Endogone sp. FLAS-F59071]|nr:hypothetical protein BC937DRAFT_95000 [Endogone sp. FLAS-F59071]|eukprot:RUS20529.1 hypothetical protein BC937DRAFT_95000 [Endogone sp. FLAS-F59071]
MCTREDREVQKRESAARLRDKFRKLDDEKKTRATKLLTDDVASRVLKRANTGGSGWWGGDSPKRSKAQTIFHKARMQAKQATQNFTPPPPTHRLSTTSAPISVPPYPRAAVPILASPTSSSEHYGRRMNVGSIPIATQPHNSHIAARRSGRQEMSPPKTPQGSPTSPGSSSAWSDDEHVHRFFAELSPPAPTSPLGRSRGGEDKPRLTMDVS